MEILSQAFDRLNHLEPFSSLPHLKKFFDFLEKHPSSHWMLPVRICKSVGGDQEDAVSIVVATIAFHTGLILIDDLLDQDDRFSRFSFTTGDQANYASALFAAAYSSLLQCPRQSSVKSRMIEYLTSCIAMTAHGQDLDTHKRITNEADYWKITSLKSSPFFSAAFYLGALIGRAPQATANLLKLVGKTYGEMIQISDDIQDCLTVPANQDWNLDRYPLPIIYAYIVEYPEKEEFVLLHSQVDNIVNLKRAQTILLRCGAISYGLYCIQEKHRQVMEQLSSVDLVNPQPINDLFSRIITPINKVIKSHTLPIKKPTMLVD